MEFIPRRLPIACLALVAMISITSALMTTAPAFAAPPALSNHGAILDTAVNGGSLTEPVARRHRARKARRDRVKRCGWQCKPYWRPYQYRYWQFYYPHGGPLFSR